MHPSRLWEQATSMDPMQTTEPSDQGRVDKVDDATAKVDDSDRREDSTQNTSLCDGPSSREEKRK